MNANRKLVQVLAPYGLWHHSKGEQVVDELSAEKMAKNSERLFAGEIPIYIGHPDETRKNCRDRRVGVVGRIAASADCILVEAAYTEDAYKKIMDGSLKSMSPRWEMESIGGGKYRPVRLISVGLTNNPNIEYSGRVVKIGRNSAEKTLCCAASKTGNAARKCLSIGRAMDEASRRLGELSQQGRKLATARRIAEFDEVKTPKCEESKPVPVSRLPEMAREFSDKTGESYTKAFARLRRGIKTNT